MRRKPNQISVSFDDEFYARLRAACKLQEHAASQLARILVEWALPFYELTQSVSKLQAFKACECMGEKRDLLQTVLRIIAERENT